jgi:hypothetical protein
MPADIPAGIEIPGPRRLSSALTEPELVAVWVLELRPPAPHLLLRWRRELDALGRQLAVRPVDVVAMEQDVAEAADQNRLARSGSAT